MSMYQTLASPTALHAVCAMCRKKYLGATLVQLVHEFSLSIGFETASSSSTTTIGDSPWCAAAISSVASRRVPAPQVASGKSMPSLLAVRPISAFEV